MSEEHNEPDIANEEQESSEEAPRRRRRNRRTYKGRRPSPKPMIVIGEDAPESEEPKQSVLEMGIEPSRARDRNVYEPTEDDNAAITEVTCDVLDTLDAEYEVEFEHGDYQRVWIDLERRRAGILIGKRGATIDSLEHLLGRMASHRVGHLIPVQVDVNGYRQRQEEELREEAQGVADRVLESGRDYHFPPMRPRDRRVIHLHVKPIDGLETFTVGEGAGRHVVVARTDD